MILRPTAIPGHCFHWIDFHGVANRSAFGEKFEFGRVYSDRDGVGVTLPLPPRRGRQQSSVVFLVDRVEYAGIEIKAWHLKSIFPDDIHLTLLILNQ